MNNEYKIEAIDSTLPFEQLYINIRNKENRIYNDIILKNLPNVPTNHQYYNEWLIRKKSCKRLIKYLNNKKQKLNILEIGCGNGWLSNQLSKIPISSILGIDVNNIEIEQAIRVFKKPNLQFMYGDIHSEVLKNKTFDIIIFAASIQYFSTFDEIMSISIKLLNNDGEIHIIDSPFYTIEEQKNAQKRTEKYYASLGYPEMSNYYFHCKINDLEKYIYKIHYKPSLFKKKFFKNSRPFHWICIKNKN